METMEALSKQAQGYEGRAESGGGHGQAGSGGAAASAAGRAAASPLVQLPHGVAGAAHLGPGGLAT